MFNHLSTMRYTWFLLFMYVLLFGITVAGAVMGLGAARDSLAHVYGDRMSTVSLLKTMHGNYLQDRIKMLQRTPNRHTLAQPAHPVMRHPVALRFDSICHDCVVDVDNTDPTYKQLSKLGIAHEEVALIDDLLAKCSAWRSERDQFLEAVRNNDFSVANHAVLLAIEQTEGLAFEHAIMALYEYQVTMVGLESARAQYDHRFNQVLFAGIFLFGILPSCAYLIATMRRMTRGLEQAKRNAASIASGDLSQDIPPQNGNDEVAQLLTQLKLMQDNLRQIVCQVQAAADTIGSAMMGGTRDLSLPPTSSLEETTSVADQAQHLTDLMRRFKV